MPLVNKEMTKKLRDIFYRPGLTVIPGGCTPYHAIMTERAGYEAFYMSGGMTHNWLIGWPDSGTVSLREMVDNANRIVKTVNIPVFSDCDTGFGNATNMYRAIQEYIRSGIAGCHIEDVEYPKGVTTSDQKPLDRGHDRERLVPIEEAVGKLKAAIDARNELDPDFVIVARTDARLALHGSFEEAIKRGKAYEAAGADVIMWEAMCSWEEHKAAIASVDVPSFCNTHPWAINQDAQGNWIPGPSLTEREAAGEKIYLAVSPALQAASEAHWETLIDLKDRGVMAVHDRRVSDEEKPQKMRLPGDLIPVTRVRELEEKYLPTSEEKGVSKPD